MLDRTSFIMHLPSSPEAFGFPPARPGRDWSDAQTNRVLSAAFNTSGVYRAMFAIGIQKFGCESVVLELIQDFAIHVWKEVIPRFDPGKQSAVLSDEKTEDGENAEGESSEAENFEADADTAMEGDGEAGTMEAASNSEVGTVSDIARCPFARWFWQSYYWFIPKWAYKHRLGFWPAQPKVPYEVVGEKPSSPRKIEIGDSNLEDWLGELLTPEEYALYEMIFVKKLTQEEIAVLLDVVRETVSRRKNGLLKKLRRVLDEQPEMAAYLQALLALGGPAEPVQSRMDIVLKIKTEVRTMTKRHREATPKAQRDEQWSRMHAQLKIDLDLLLWKADHIIHAPRPQAEELAQEAITMVSTLAQTHPILAKYLEEVRTLIFRLLPPTLRRKMPDHDREHSI